MKTSLEMTEMLPEWATMKSLAAWVIEQGLSVQQIPAPTFDERTRAAYVAGQFTALGLTDISTDALYNVYGRIPGAHATLPATLISAHTDTIFAADTDLSIRHEPGLIYAPGLGDNSMGVSGMFGLAHYLQTDHITPACDLWFVATTREEGLGDLGGMRAAFERLRSRIDGVINLEGLAYGHVYHAGIAVRRLHITVTTPGGHSWLHFGRPSALHVLVDLASRITAIKPSTSPRTTFNIGMIDGGEAINAIATRANLWLDMRSEDRDALAALEKHIRADAAALRRTDVEIKIDVVGDRPAGFLAPSHPLVQMAVMALDKQGVRASLETGSTDANIPLAQDCPAVTIGITRGGNAHRLDEYIEIEPVAAGMRQLIMLTLASADAKLPKTK